MKTNYSPCTFHELKLARNWDGDDSVPIHRSTTAAAELVPYAVTQTFKQTAAYVFNPAIVQQLWPPPRHLGGIPMSIEQQSLSFTFAHKEAIFKPASTRFSAAQRSIGQ